MPPTRLLGTLVRWNAERGFGFISPDAGGTDIFVHASDMSRIGGAPEAGWRLDFQVRNGKDGRLRAFDVQREGLPLVRVTNRADRPASPRPAQTSRPVRARASGRRFAAMALVLVAMLGAGAYFKQRETQSARPVAPLALASPAAGGAPTPAFSCDGRTRCPQMTSCAEATYFVQHCPDTEMDGDGDGVPCEQQWCQ